MGNMIIATHVPNILKLNSLLLSKVMPIPVKAASVNKIINVIEMIFILL
jgi:hypothetical protein